MPKPAGPVGDELADAAEPDDAERLVGQLDALPLAALPAPGDERRVGLGHVAGLGQQQRHRVLGGRDDVALRRVDDHHAAGGGGVDVDVVEADAGPTDDEEVGAGGQHLVGDRGRRADDQGVGADDGRRAAARRTARCCTSTSWPAARRRSSPPSAISSVTRMRAIGRHAYRPRSADTNGLNTKHTPVSDPSACCHPSARAGSPAPGTRTARDTRIGDGYGPGRGGGRCARGDRAVVRRARVAALRRAARHGGRDLGTGAAAA